MRDQALDALAAEVAQMGGLAENLMSTAIESVARRNIRLAEATIAGDEEVDSWQRRIEEHVAAAMGAAAGDPALLRDLVGVVKIGVDLERIGDLAKNVAKRALVFNQEEPVRLTQSLVRMGRIGLNQLKLALDAHSDRDGDAALMVWRGDEEIDELYNSLFRELVTYMMEDPRTISYCAHLLFVAKNFERVGDHATNIAETVYYVATGRYLRSARPKGDLTSVMQPTKAP